MLFWYDRNMLLAIAIVLIQQFTFLNFMLESKFFTRETSAETYALMIAVALYSAFLSVPSFVWNFNILRSDKRKINSLGVILSILTFIFGIVYLVAAYLIKLHTVGKTFI